MTSLTVFTVRPSSSQFSASYRPAVVVGVAWIAPRSRGPTLFLTVAWTTLECGRSKVRG